VLNARAKETTITPTDMGTGGVSCKLEEMRKGGLHMILNCLWRDMTPPSGPDSSRAFIPKRLDINERGRKIIVIMVNIMIARPCVTLSSARARDALASMILACCCLRSSRSFS